MYFLYMYDWKFLRYVCMCVYICVCVCLWIINFEIKTIFSSPSKIIFRII